MFVTENILKTVFKETSTDVLFAYYNLMDWCFKGFNIDTIYREASFISQIGYESNRFRRIEENLNYSEERLLQVFPKYFTAKEANLYARKPEKIANRIYSDRMGNGNEKSGDGWKYRGRGLIQLTGKSNYADFAKWAKLSLDETIEWLGTAQGAMASAGWYWYIYGCNELADKEDIIGITKRINGGLHGIKERKLLYIQLRDLIRG